MRNLPAGWSGRAVTRQSSSQADIWMMAPDGSKLRSVIDVDNWHAMNNKVRERERDRDRQRQRQRQRDRDRQRANSAQQQQGEREEERQTETETETDS